MRGFCIGRVLWFQQGFYPPHIPPAHCTGPYFPVIAGLNRFFPDSRLISAMSFAFGWPVSGILAPSTVLLWKIQEIKRPFHLKNHSSHARVKSPDKLHCMTGESSEHRRACGRYRPLVGSRANGPTCEVGIGKSLSFPMLDLIDLSGIV